MKIKHSCGGNLEESPFGFHSILQKYFFLLQSYDNILVICITAGISWTCPSSAAANGTKSSSWSTKKNTRTTATGKSLITQYKYMHFVAIFCILKQRSITVLGGKSDSNNAFLQTIPQSSLFRTLISRIYATFITTSPVSLPQNETDRFLISFDFVKERK